MPQYRKDKTVIMFANRNSSAYILTNYTLQKRYKGCGRSVQRADKVACKNAVQQNCQPYAHKTCKLYYKALSAFAFFAQVNGVAKTDTAGQCRRGCDYRQHPADYTKKAMVIGCGNHTKKEIHWRQAEVHRQKQQVCNNADSVQSGVDCVWGFFGAQGQIKQCHKGNNCHGNCVQEQYNPSPAV